MTFTNYHEQAKHLLINDSKFKSKVWDILYAATIGLNDTSDEFDESGALLPNKATNECPSKFEPYVATAEMLLAFRNGTLSEQDALDAMYKIALEQRNSYMRRNSSIASYLCEEFSQHTLDCYEQYRPQDSEAARALVCQKLGYEPPLKISMQAELSMRIFFEQEEQYKEQRIDIDTSSLREFMLKSSCIKLKYREAFLEGGWEAADKSPLPFFDREGIQCYLVKKRA